MSRFHLDQLTDLAERRRCAMLRYRSRLTPSRRFDRLVEPYGLVQGKEDVMVRCYQLHPTEGWRTFMVHKIDDVEDAGVSFRPRRDVTLPGDESLTFGGLWQDAPWTEDLIEYRDMVADAIGDGLVDKDTLDQIKAFAADAHLSEDDIRYVHAALFHRALGQLLREGAIGEPQLAELRLVQRILSGLGWGVTGAAR